MARLSTHNILHTALTKLHITLLALHTELTVLHTVDCSPHHTHPTAHCRHCPPQSTPCTPQSTPCIPQSTPCIPSSAPCTHSVLSVTTALHTDFVFWFGYQVCKQWFCIHYQVQNSWPYRTFHFYQLYDIHRNVHYVKGEKSICDDRWWDNYSLSWPITHSHTLLTDSPHTPLSQAVGDTVGTSTDCTHCWTGMKESRLIPDGNSLTKQQIWTLDLQLIKALSSCWNPNLVSFWLVRLEKKIFEEIY